MSIFSNLFTPKNEQRIALALDIGTEFVKAIIFEIHRETETGNIIGVGRAKQELGHMHLGAVTDIKGVVKTCEQAIEQAGQQAGRIPEQVILGIAGELVKGTTTTVNYERANPNQKLDETELQNIVHKVQWKAFDDARQQLAWETGHTEIDVKLINASIVDTKIDGYQVANPIDFQGRDVTMSIFNAYAPLVHLGALQTIIEELDLQLLTIAAEPYAVAKCMGKEEHSSFDAIFIDIGGGTTDIAVVRRGGVDGTKMFGLGGRAFTKRIAEDLGISMHDAEEVKLEYSRENLTPESTTKIKKILKNDIEVWLSGINLSLSEFAEEDHLPSTILLCGGGSALPGIQEALKAKSWRKNLPFPKDPHIRFITPEDITTIEDQTGDVQHPQDITPMGLANLSLDFVSEDEVMSDILKKVVRMMQT